MQRFKLEQSNADIVSHAGLALVGQAIKKQTRLKQELDIRVSRRHGIKHSNVLKSDLALLSTGKNCFEAINNIESEFYLMRSMDVKEIPCRALQNAQVVIAQLILLRLDGGNDEIENIDIVLEHNLQNPDQTEIDFLIRWNPRRQNKKD